MKRRKFRALFVTTQSPGLNWYRTVSMAKHMDIETKIWPPHNPKAIPNWEDVLIYQGIKGNKLVNDLGKLFEWADIIVAQRVMSAQGLYTLEGLARHFKKKVMVEIDDDAFNVDSSNPAFAGVGPGSQKIREFEFQLKGSYGVITSTQYLKDLYDQYNKNVHVVKNGIDFGVWDRLSKPKFDNKRIRIGWQGAWHHHEDLELIAGVMPKIIKKHKVKFHFFGFLPDYLKGCAKFHKMVPIDKYPKMMIDANLDIILAPLYDTSFNRGKSNLRVLEAGAMRKPIIASGNKSLPYAMTITDKEDGLLVNSTQEWVDAITYLIENEKERKRLGNNLYKKVKSQYNVKDIAKQYESILKEE